MTDPSDPIASSLNAYLRSVNLLVVRHGPLVPVVSSLPARRTLYHSHRTLAIVIVTPALCTSLMYSIYKRLS